jgi:hypothetical protein
MHPIVILVFIMGTWGFFFVRRSQPRFGLQLMLLLGSLLIPFLSGLISAWMGLRGIFDEPMSFWETVSYFANLSMGLQMFYWIPTVGVSMLLASIESVESVVVDFVFFFLCGIGFCAMLGDMVFGAANLAFIAICLAIWAFHAHVVTVRNSRDEDSRAEARLARLAAKQAEEKR